MVVVARGVASIHVKLIGGGVGGKSWHCGHPARKQHWLADAAGMQTYPYSTCTLGKHGVLRTAEEESKLVKARHARRF